MIDSRLPLIKKKARIPNKKESLELLKRYNFPKEKFKHVKLVAKLALFLAEELKSKGLKINTKLVEAAALLHDIDKGAKTIPNYKKTHPFLGAKILKKEGYEKVAQIALNHDLSAFLDKKRTPKSLEEKIVALADKMVKNKVICVDERFKLWGKENLPKKEQEILRKSYPKLKKLEKEIFGILKISPEEIIKKIN